MKPTSIIIALVLGVVAVTGTVWLGQASPPPPPPPKEAPKPTAPSAEEELPQKGPPAKAVVDNLVHDFGVMEKNSKGEHVFTIRNEGEGTLLLEKGTATCKCTKFSLGDSEDTKELELAPGESTKVTVAWKVISTTSAFEQRARVRTNDPDQRKLAFVIRGKSARNLFVLPSRNLIVPDIGSIEPGRVSAVFGTKLLDEFEILSLTSSSKFMTAELIPIEGDDLKKFEAKAAYQINVTIQPEIPVGRFRGYITVKSSGNGKTYEQDLEINTNRTGAIRVIGQRFSQKTMTLHMKRFSIVDGQLAKLNMFVNDSDGKDIEFHIVDSDNENVKLTIERDEKFQGRKQLRFQLTFEIPPGKLTKPDTKGRATIKVESNHPDIKSVSFSVAYQAY